MIVKRLLTASFALVSLLSVPAVAARFDGAKATEEWYVALGACQGANFEDAKTSERGCVKRDRLAKSLQANGYCFDKGEQEWALCRAKP